ERRRGRSRRSRDRTLHPRDQRSHPALGTGGAPGVLKAGRWRPLFGPPSVGPSSVYPALQPSRLLPSRPMKLILASNNDKKLHELQALLGPLGLQLHTQGSLGISEAEEPHHTFVENALAKARHASRLGQAPAIADDS